jgi:hypothetical protein
MSFRKVGGVQYSATQNVVKSRYTISDQSYISQYVGEPNTVIDFLSDISGNLSDGMVGIANNISGGQAGDILYQSGANITSKLHIGVSGEILTSNGMNPYWAPTFDLSMVLSKGNSAGPYGINMNSQNILNAMTIYAASFNSTSDYRIKENIMNLDDTHTIDQLRPVQYFNTKLQKHDIGLIANELQEIYPFLVTGQKDGNELQTVNYNGLICILIKEIQELKEKIKKLEDKDEI